MEFAGIKVFRGPEKEYEPYVQIHISHFWKVKTALALFHTLHVVAPHVVAALLTFKFLFEVSKEIRVQNFPRC